jgi:hypothetical protein
MKTIRIQKMFAVAGLTLATAVFATLSFAANAQYRAVGADGIAASPKVRQALNATAVSTTSATAKVAAMACPKCTDISVAAPTRQAKGAEVLAGATKVVAKHTCAGCDSSLNVVGTGKDKHNVATHKCTANVANTQICCGAMK